ncbi:hypothetical protein C8R48DRAFT_675440 [Suillus tomentosus]|nr:hypothetical protein C8R48DRAFT_675440 [Suillus tomentosus]
MTSDSDWDSRSVDSRPSDFNDGAEAILMNTSFKMETPNGDDQSRGSTPESHKDCHEYPGHGQGAPVYSCSCYKYREMERYKFLKYSPPDPEHALESGNDNPIIIDVLNAKRKIRDENDNTLHSSFQDITNVQAASVPVIELPPAKRRKLRRQSELSERKSLAKVAQEIAVVREALGRIQEILVGEV